MNLNVENLVKLSYQQSLQLQKHAPKILFTTGIVGFVATTVLASHATLKMDTVLEEVQADLKLAKSIRDETKFADYNEEEYKKDITIIYARAAIDVTKLYLPAIVAGTISIAALTKSHQILTTRNAGLTAAYAALDKAYAQYRKRVQTEYGEEAERELFYRDASDSKLQRETSTDSQDLKDVDNFINSKNIGMSVYAKFFDELNVNWNKTPEYNQMFIRAQQNHANDLLHARGHVFLNEVYDMLGIERTPAGAVVGWVLSKSGDNYIDFGVFDGRDQKKRDFVNGLERSVLLDFNVDGVVYDKI